MGTRQYVWWNSLWCVVVGAALVLEVAALNGPHVCMVQQKYNITKRVKYRAPMSVRTYEWCFSMPPRCSKWKTEMRELTKLETDERIAEVAVCCPGYKMKDVSCVPICPNGKTGHHCSEACPPTKWGPNCVHACDPCVHGACDPTTGECSCHHGWQGESCESRMPPPTTVAVEDLLTKATKTTTAYTSTILPSTTPIVPSPTSTTILTSPSTISPANIYSSATNSSTNSTVSTPITSTTVSILSTTLTTSKPTSKITTTLATTESTSTITTEASTSPKPLTESTIVTSTSTVSTTILNSSPTETDIANITIVATSPTTISNGTTTVISITEPVQTTHVNNVTLTFPIIVTTEMSRQIEESTNETVAKTIYNHTEKPQEKKTIKDIFVEVKTIPDSRSKPYETTKVVQTKTTYSNMSYHTETTIFTTEKSLKEVTKRPEATFRYFPTTVKFKPKEIWIRPAQKGDSIEKIKELARHKPTNTAPITTPKTIIVSIIPTSVSYTTFKKVSLTTASTLTQKSTVKGNKTNEGVTRPMTSSTSPPIKLSTKMLSTKSNSSKLEPLIHKVTKPTFRSKDSKTTLYINGTNSMTTVKLNSSHFITAAPSTNSIKTQKTTETITTFKAITLAKNVERETRAPFIKIINTKPRNVSLVHVSGKGDFKLTKTVAKEETNVTKTVNDNANMTNQVIEKQEDEETFHILTEPEHITAVMEGKGKEQSSLDLVSVISIAVGVMMIIITVAVIIVMLERCRKPRYDDVRKINDIHMQVMIDNNDVPPPYVRSIFHTPLPAPPTSEKCHYQPISTLDRNLKQFMRPVVVQTISPIMLENFRGILECHYDHLPRRSYNFEASPRHCSITPSMDGVDELACLRPCSIADSTIEALKCEAKMDVIDHTTNEPLYAEIPCWRPPSEHAIEIMNMNGEAVTEL